MRNNHIIIILFENRLKNNRYSNKSLILRIISLLRVGSV